MDIIVTTPKTEMQTAAQEAQELIAAGGGHYFRRLGFIRDGKVVGYPRNLYVGDRVWYIEDNYVRGFNIVAEITLDLIGRVCETTGRWYRPGCYVWMQADQWVWIKPVKYQGFQNWRYHKQGISTHPIGGWLDPRPAISESLHQQLEGKP